jgi:hypothetical protein
MAPTFNAVVVAPAAIVVTAPAVAASIPAAAAAVPTAPPTEAPMAVVPAAMVAPTGPAVATTVVVMPAAAVATADKTGKINNILKSSSCLRHCFLPSTLNTGLLFQKVVSLDKKNLLKDSLSPDLLTDSSQFSPFSRNCL